MKEPTNEGGESSDPVVLSRLSGIEARDVEWLWPGRVPLGKFTLFQGDPCVGKSFVTMDIAARVSTGSGWPDIPDQRNPPGDVILLSAEDDAADTIKPRLVSLGGDPSRVSVLDGVKHRHDASPDPFCLGRHVRLLAETLARLRSVRLIVIDPIAAYMGEVDSHANADVRRVLAPLTDLAARAGVAVVGVTHLNKASGTKAIYRGTGSLAFVAAARASWSFQKDPDDPERRYMLPVKINIARESKGLAYRIVGDPPRVEWEDQPISLTPDEVFAAEASAGEPDSRVRAAERWLDEYLRDGPKGAVEIIEAGQAAGHSERTLTRAKRKLGVQSRKNGFRGASAWLLPAAQSVPNPPKDATL